MKGVDGMHTGNLIILVGSAWILQYILTWFQLQHYRKTMRKLVIAYQGQAQYALFSGVCRKALGRGAIVIAIIDQHEVVHRCEVLSGISVFAKFKPFPGQVGKMLGEIGQEANHILVQKRGVSARQKSQAKALLMIVENAQRSYAEKRHQAGHGLRTQKAIP